MNYLNYKIKDLFYLSPLELFELNENEQLNSINKNKVVVSITKNQQPLFIDECLLFATLIIFIIFIGVFISFYTPMWFIAKNLKNVNEE